MTKVVRLEPEILRTINVPFTAQEIGLLAERAAAHGLALVDFVRFCSLSNPTPLEAASVRRTGKDE
jgi:hypothetical protein